MSSKPKILIVGAGLSGATIAEHYARDGIPVVILDKRNHIAGNVYDEIDEQTGIRVSKYGAHLFHTNDEGVWKYIQEFATWIRWDHKVIAKIELGESGESTLAPVPVNRTTINTLFQTHFQTDHEVQTWLEEECVKGGAIRTSEDSALSRVGPRLYSLLFKPYTSKQWGRDASELEPSVLERIPVRFNTDDRYFTDRYQALPREGYTAFVRRMLDNPLITIRLNTSWEDVSHESWDTIVFTGPIDTYFKSAGLAPLEYRSITFHTERYKTAGFHQPNSVVNTPSLNTPFTRSIEYKHFLHQQSDWTIVVKETSCAEGEPYYPVPNETNRLLYEQYVELAKGDKKVHFIGRLANYKYFNMDQAIRNAMDYYHGVLKVTNQTVAADSCGPAVSGNEQP